jgi:peptide/nickel transport system substrate-binding protein
MRNKILKYTIILGIILFALKACIVVDKPSATKPESNQKIDMSLEIKPKPPFETVYKDGVDFLVARGEVGKFGGEFHASAIGEGPKTFNPWESKDATSSMMGGLMWDGLVTTDAYTGDVIPKMAKSIKISPDNKEYTLTLRRGLKWSDGKPITADDVVFTWGTIILGGFGNTSTRDNLYIDGKLPTVKKIDDYTVKFTTPGVFAPFLRQLGAPIGPKHILEPITKKGKMAFSSFWGVSTPPSKFITSGPFKLREYTPAQRVTFIRNPNYYMVDKQMRRLPYLNKYIVYIVGDLNNEVLKFEAGELDILSVRGNNVARFKALEKHGHYKLYNLGPDTSTVFMCFNMNDRKNDKGKYFVPPYKEKWFQDINFRTAIDYAIDRNAMVSNVLYGVGAPLFTAESLSSLYLNKNLAKGHPKDHNKSKELLLKSGFYYKGDKLYDKTGHRVEFELLTNAGNTERESVGVIIKQDLEELGIKVNFKPIEFNSLVGKLLNSYDWDTSIIGLTGSPLDPHSGKTVWEPTGTMHFFNMKDPTPALWEKQLEAIFNQAARVLDINKRKEYYNKYQQIVYDKKPMLYLYSPVTIIAVRDKLGNVDPTPLGGSTHNIEEIYIK